MKTKALAQLENERIRVLLRIEQLKISGSRTLREQKERKGRIQWPKPTQ